MDEESTSLAIPAGELAAAPDRALNMTRVMRDASVLAVSNLGMRAITALVTLWVIRYLGPADFGVLGLALSISVVAVYLTEAGLDHTFLRQASIPDADLCDATGSTLRLRLALASLVTVLALAGVLFGPGTSERRWVVAALVVPATWGAALRGTAEIYFQHQRRLHVTAGFELLNGITTAVALILAITLKLKLPYFGVAHGSAQLLAGVVAIAAVAREVSIRKADAIRRHLDGFGWLLLAGLGATLLPQLGPIVLSRTDTISAVGIFAAGARLVALLYLMPSVVGRSFYAALHSSVHSTTTEYDRVLESEIRTIGIITVALSVAMSAFALPVVKTVLGPQWQSQTPTVVAVLAWLIPLQGIRVPLGQALITQKQLTAYSAGTMSSALVAVVLYWLGSRTFGLVGAAAGAVVTELLTTVVLFALLRRSHRPVLRAVRWLGMVVVMGSVVGLGARMLHVTVYAAFPGSAAVTAFCALLMWPEARKAAVARARALAGAQTRLV